MEQMPKKFVLFLVVVLWLCPSSRASTDYGPAIDRPMSCTKWYTTGNGHHFCVIHDMEGYYWSSISYLNRCDQNTNGSYNVSASIHYLVNGLQNGSDEDGHNENYPADPAAGEISQSVREANYAWHALCWNRWSWGTEHEGFVSSPAWYTEAMYVASAGLQRHLMLQTSDPIDRNHIIGHNENQTASWVTWMAANYPSVDATCNTHTDPGVYWNWSHFMALILGAPTAPTNLVLLPISTTQIKLTWTDSATNETGFKIERATSVGGPWSQISTTAVNGVTYTNSGLVASTVYYYRVRAYNADGDSDYCAIKSATTGNAAPVLATVGNKTLVEGSLLSFTASATDAGLGATTLITDFESYSSGTASILFQKPTYSGSTRGVDPTPTNYTIVASTFPAGTGKGTRVLKTSWSFLAGSSNWVRLTTVSVSTFPRPVIDLKQILKFDIYTDTSLKLAVCASETGNPVGTAIGSDGGSSSSYEWAGVTNVNSTAPVPTRTIPANTWTTVQFNLPFEPITPFALDAANGVLSSPTGLGALEHLALVPTSTAAGTHTIYMDNFSVVYSNILTYSLDPGAPAGASINPYTGLFIWTPTEAQGPGVYDITIRVTDNGSPALSDFETISVVVSETNNFTPTLVAIPDKTVLAGDTLTFTNSAADSDLPLELIFSLDPGAPTGAGVNPGSGIFNWATPVDSPDSTNSITVRVSDNGTPEKTATRTFNARVVSRMLTFTPGVNLENMALSWSTIPGKSYRVQFKSDLSETEWSNATGDIVATGTSMQQHIPIASSGQRYYRIMQLP